MRIRQKGNYVNIDELKSALEIKYTDYGVKVISKNSILVSKSKAVGVIISVKKKYIYIEADFPKWYSKLIYYLSYLILGIIISVIIYYTVYYKKFKTIKKEIENFIKLQCCSSEIQTT
jgi:hypothetical protein